ncbi:fumarylacetoacetate hydrolase family protein [Arcanobacterium ihumii]|uniref:fumarylacetoacetate hydrolase family protein n=1 Tax=Arcanobacterium ihumii TaxID=2138162 RepID=UPI000F5243D3|nr:fumarylacetoacetate hydrolase family protein [Arcanobacterium ihumii]
MKIARLSLEQGPRFAILDVENQKYHVIAGDPMYSGIEQTGQVFKEDEVHLVAPMLPRSKVIGSTQNFDENMSNPRGGGWYLKPNTAVVGPDVPVVIPTWANGVTSAPNLGVVISRPCRDVPADRVADVIFGYTVVNAVSAPEYAHSSPAHAYGFDTSCPLGPVIDTALSTDELHVFVEINDDVASATVTVNVDNIASYVSAVSEIFSLLPGDIILLGDLIVPTAITPGDDVVVAIEEIGDLRNPVVAS